MKNNPARRFDGQIALVVVPHLSSEGEAVSFILVENKTIVGYLDMTDFEGEYYVVDYSAAEHGYGPLIYEAALEWARRNNIRVSPGVASVAAETVWRRFYERPDVLSQEVRHDPAPLWLRSACWKVDELPGYDGALERGDMLVQESGLSQQEAFGRLRRAGQDFYRQMTGQAYQQTTWKLKARLMR